MFKYIFPILLLISSTPAQAQENVDIEKLLINSIGGEKALESLKNVENIENDGVVKLNGIEGTFKSIFEMPDKFYMKLEFPMFTMTQAYDGQTMWMEDMNGQISEISGVEKNEALTNLYFESYSYIFKDRMPGSYQLKGDTTFDNQEFYIIEFYPFDQDTIITLFNKETSLPEYKLSYLENQQSISYASDFRLIDNILLPHYSKAENPAAGSLLEFIADKIELNQVIDPQIFKPNKESLIDYIFPPDKDSVSIPFQFEAGHIYISAKINNSKIVTFLLDSGASKNIFHSKTFDSLNLPVVGTMHAMGVSGYNEVNLVKTDSINIGGLLMLNQIAGAMDISQSMPRFNSMKEFGGILGFDFLSRLPLKIDYKNRIITVYNPDNFTPPSDGSVIDFDYTMNVPTINCEINGVKGSYIVDLGNSLGLILFPEYLEKNNMMEKFSNVQENSKLLSGVGGSVSGKNALVDSFKLSPDIQLDSLLVLIPESSKGLTGFSNIAGNIGNLILNNFDVLFDYNNSQIILYPTN